ncbi:fructosamine kinase [Planobispora rosea]|uniref:Fructosamine kinase n=1 Tax=Planobispora rosea TaxID=35762 RepID=A0A8J3S8S5_PLARO|nr:fructosamine kinase family protein [Planobispora rosea]GGS92122.1 fructosamine kinase [Planobispora rosea]GIH87099.1 fructosamine kinase [Planobispora rosea]
MRIVEDLGASHAWRLHRAELPDGRHAFVKTGGSGRLFASEAAGLRWLGEAGAVAVPEVIDVSDGRLVLSWVETTRPTPEAAERFGRELARLHGAGAAGFGAPWPGFIAELPMDNTPVDDTPTADWPSFYACRRVLPFVRRARDGGWLSARDAALLDGICSRLADVSGPDEPPSRIHGDLWSGNVLWAAGGAVLVDPAAHGGHRETDLAMLALFGAPHLDRILAAYEEESPPAAGWRERVPLHQLHPLLVHVCLYGRAYRDGLMAAVERVQAI